MRQIFFAIVRLMPKQHEAHWDISQVTPPWGSRPSIYTFLAAHSTENYSRLPLPDEDDQECQTVQPLVADELASTPTFQNANEPDPDFAEAWFTSLKSLSFMATDSNAMAFYRQCVCWRAYDDFNMLVPTLIHQQEIDRSRLHAIGRWLVLGAADRNAVRWGLVLLGITACQEDISLIVQLSRHDAFDVDATRALIMREDDTEELCWELAKLLTGWDRIFLIERLQHTQRPEIQDWLLREGYRNDILDEYTALFCAQGGRLLEALSVENPDDQLLECAGEILMALFPEGPTIGISGYPDGPEVIKRYLHHLAGRELNLTYRETLKILINYMRAYKNERFDWPTLRESLIAQAVELLDGKKWEKQIRLDLTSKDPKTFCLAVAAAQETEVGFWDALFERLESGDNNYWIIAARVVTAEQVNRLISLIERFFLPDDFNIAPTTSRKEQNSGKQLYLCCLIEVLGQFPGKGWSLLYAALKSPIPRNRLLAVEVLSIWGKSNWPVDAKVCLERALDNEPNEFLQNKLHQVLAGEQIDLTVTSAFHKRVNIDIIHLF